MYKYSYIQISARSGTDFKIAICKYLDLPTLLQASVWQVWLLYARLILHVRAIEAEKMLTWNRVSLQTTMHRWFP